MSLPPGFASVVLGLLLMLGSAALAQAQTPDPDAAARISAADAASQTVAKAQSDAQAQIDATNAQIAQLKAEIAQLQSQLNSTTAQKTTLQNAIKQLDLQIQKLQKSLSLTTTQIKQKDTEISTLSGNITTTQGEIDTTSQGVADSLRELQQLDQEPLGTVLLAGGTLSDFFDQAVTLSTLRTNLQNKIDELSSLKDNLQTSKSSAEDKRSQLATLKKNLSQQQQGVAAAKADQSNLLIQTKNQESQYQKLIAQKQTQEAQFEADLQKYEASLGLSVAVGSLPGARAGVLSWPLDNIRITQYFGNTDFATKNPQIYNGKGHTGVDFAASTGTRVLSALDGVVLGTGNTDLTCPNASFGKWVFIKHGNGLSTLYAHLSVISVSSGQQVQTGDVVGYSGSTGYATGPHLHFGVYASSGSEIASFPSSSCKGKTYTMPVGDVSAYLNPLSYLPAL